MYIYSLSLLCTFGYLGPVVFQSHPQTIEIATNNSAHLSCSYNNHTTVSFSLIKDEVVVNISEVTWVSIKAKAVAIHSEGFSAGTQINESISFRVTSVTEQGLYWCRVKDASGRIFDSQKASIILSGTSDTYESYI